MKTVYIVFDKFDSVNISTATLVRETNKLVEIVDEEALLGKAKTHNSLLNKDNYFVTEDFEEALDHAEIVIHALKSKIESKINRLEIELLKLDELWENR